MAEVDFFGISSFSTTYRMSSQDSTGIDIRALYSLYSLPVDHPPLPTVKNRNESSFQFSMTEPGVGKGRAPRVVCFCSERCFTHYRRAAFKKNKCEH